MIEPRERVFDLGPKRSPVSCESLAQNDSAMLRLNG